jgi:hypothetical protein
MCLRKITTCGLLPLITSSILMKSPSALVTTADLIGAEFVRVGTDSANSGMSQTVLSLLYSARPDTGAWFGLVKALVDATARAERAAMEVTDLMFLLRPTQTVNGAEEWLGEMRNSFSRGESVAR